VPPSPHAQVLRRTRPESLEHGEMTLR
jgi:hypothetical protein